MLRKICIAILLIGTQLASKAQENALAEKYLSGAASPRGNYVYLMNDAGMSGDNADLYKSTDYFIIERVPYEAIREDAKKVSVKKLAELRPVSSLRELQKLFSAKDIQQMKTLYGLKSDNDLLNYFKTHSKPNDYPFAYSFIETRQALGHVFLDEDVKEGQVYVYDVTRVTKQKTKESWGYTIIQSKSGNYTLPYFKPRISAVYTKDSLVQITWKLRVSPELLSTIPVPHSVIAEDSAGGLLRMPFPPSAIRAKVMLQSSEKFDETERVMPVLNASGDTASYLFQKKCVPGEQVVAYLLTEDEVHNQGIASDTALTFAVEEKSLPLIYGIRVKEIINGIQLSWDPLPAKPFIAGVEIRRTDGHGQDDSLITLPPSDTSFIDYRIQVGEQYRYKVKAVFIPQLGLTQKIPAEGVGSFVLFTKPLAPFNLTAENKDRNVLLKWEAIDEPSFYGFYVYRGTSPKKLDLIAGPVFTKSFLDTAGSLSGRNPYYYAIMNQNLRQDTSDLSPIVSIIPNRTVNTTVPNNVEFYYANRVLRVSWNDVRVNDNAIEGFLVQKRERGKKDFTTITPKPVTTNFIEDTVLRADLFYEYRVAAVTFRGDVSDYGETAGFSVPKKDVPIMDVFYVRNVTEGINISWPEIETDRKAYNIYRREAGKDNFKKIASVDAKTFFYVDKTAKPGEVYVYAMSITENDNREGARGASISVRRNKL